MRANLVNCTQLLKAEDCIKTLHLLKVEFRMASCFEKTHAIELEELNKGEKVSMWT